MFNGNCFVRKYSTVVVGRLLLCGVLGEVQNEVRSYGGSTLSCSTVRYCVGEENVKSLLTDHLVDE